MVLDSFEILLYIIYYCWADERHLINLFVYLFFSFICQFTALSVFVTYYSQLISICLQHLFIRYVCIDYSPVHYFELVEYSIYVCCSIFFHLYTNIFIYLLFSVCMYRLFSVQQTCPHLLTYK